MKVIDEKLLAAHVSAICDVFATFVFEYRTLAAVLAQKGLLTATELQQATASLPPGAYAKFSADLHETLRNRTAEWMKEMENAQ